MSGTGRGGWGGTGGSGPSVKAEHGGAGPGAAAAFPGCSRLRGGPEGSVRGAASRPPPGVWRVPAGVCPPVPRPAVTAAGPSPSILAGLRRCSPLRLWPR